MFYHTNFELGKGIQCDVIECKRAKTKYLKDFTVSPQGEAAAASIAYLHPIGTSESETEGKKIINGYKICKAVVRIIG